MKSRQITRGLTTSGSKGSLTSTHTSLRREGFTSNHTLLRKSPRNLTVNKAGDAHERQADRIADQVSGKSHNHRQTSSARGPVAAPAIVDEVLSTPGRSLDGATRNSMESRFGHDFSNVRIHTDGKAAASAKSVEAAAYTVGNHAVFNANRFAPETPAGDRLLAHELAHVVQQSGGAHERGIQREPDTEETSVAPPFKGSLGMRAPIRLNIADPRTDAWANTDWYRVLPQVVGLSTKWFSEKYPGFDDAAYKRIIELGLTVGWQVPWMVIDHEYGHYRVADQYGFGPDVELLNWYKGITHIQNKSKFFQAPIEQHLQFDQAGVNQERFNSMRMFVDWALNNSIDVHEAFAFLASRTNMAFYAARSSVGGGTGPQDDLVKYSNATGVSTEKLFVMSMAADLLSASTWAAFIPIFTKFLAKGQRRFQIPTTEIAGVRTAWPNFNVVLTSKGPVVGGQVVVGVDRKMPVEVTIETGVDAMALGAKVHGVPLFGHLTAGPFMRATIGDPPALILGSDLRYDISKKLSITGTFEYQLNQDILAEPTGKTKTWSGGVSVGLSLP